MSPAEPSAAPLPALPAPSRAEAERWVADVVAGGAFDPAQAVALASSLRDARVRDILAAAALEIKRAQTGERVTVSRNIDPETNNDGRTPNERGRCASLTSTKNCSRRSLPKRRAYRRFCEYFPR